jgi:hypothetical protein
VQLHRGGTTSVDKIVVPGEALTWRNFDITLGLAQLREELKHMTTGEGVVIIGQMGLTSHVADVLRKAGFPAKIA